MTDRIALNEPEFGPVIAKLAGTDYHPGVCVNFARVVNDEFLGGVLFSNFTGESMEAHTAAVTPMWLNRDLLFVAFDYPFVQLDVKRLFCRIAADNVRTLNFNRNLGFTPVAVIEGVFPGDVACIVTCMERQNCRFLNIRPRTLKIGPTFH